VFFVPALRQSYGFGLYGVIQIRLKLGYFICVNLRILCHLRSKNLRNVINRWRKPVVFANAELNSPAASVGHPVVRFTKSLLFVLCSLFS